MKKQQQFSPQKPGSTTKLKDPQDESPNSSPIKPKLQSQPKSPPINTYQNSVIIDGPKKIIYLPAYLRLKLKNFVKMDLQNLDVELNVSIILDIYYGQSNFYSSIIRHLPSQHKLKKKDQSHIRDLIINALENKLVLHFQKDQGMAAKQIDDSEKQLEVTLKNQKEKQDKQKYKDKNKKNQQKQQQNTKIKKDNVENRLKYTIRRKINAKVQPDVFFTPFQIINSIVTIAVKSIYLGNLGFTIAFNLMDHDNEFLKMSYDTADSFGNYSLAWSRMRTIYTNQRVTDLRFYSNDLKEVEKAHEYRKQELIQAENKKKQYIKELQERPFKGEVQVAVIETYKQEKPLRQFQSYKYANFMVPIYKFPSVQILTIFLPLVLLSVINLGIFFQNYDLHDRIASISVLLIAFVALVPTLRDELPPTNKIVLIEILVYFQTYTSIIALAHSLTVMVDQIQLRMDWNAQGLTSDDYPRYELNLKNASFLIAVIITCLVNFIITVLVLIHKCVWEPSYNKKSLLIEEKEEFNPLNWGHKKCWEVLRNMLDDNVFARPENEFTSEEKDKRLQKEQEKKKQQDKIEFYPIRVTPADQ